MDREQQAQKFINDRKIWMPDYLQRSMGQFNVFAIKNNGITNTDCKPYDRKGFYKISLIHGHTKFFYADQNQESKESALLFSNPKIPYAWEHVGQEHSGFYCVFTESFIDQQKHLKEYPVFKPGNNHLFELTPEQAKRIQLIFENMIAEIESDFQYKYDALRNMIFELIFAALKLEPVPETTKEKEPGSATRITSLFTELLERQFPIESPSQMVELRTPADFAEHLSVHINHLNRTLKKVTGKTTSQLIAERLVQEARILLKHTDWNISEIAWCLGFEDLPHFIHFFKKNETQTPKNFRKGE